MEFTDLIKEKNKKRFRLIHPLSRGALSVFMLTILTPVATANMVGSDTQNFNPALSGHDFITVHSSKTLGKGQLSLGLFTNHAINTLPYFEDEENSKNEKAKRYNDGLTTADLSVGYGVLPIWDIGLSLSGVVYQDVKKKDSFHGQFRDKGLTQIRLLTKVKLWNNGFTGLGVVASANFNMIKDNPYKGEDNSPTYNIEMILDSNIGNFSFAANLGYRLKKTGKPEKVETANNEEIAPIDPIDNQMIGSTAISYHIPGTKTDIIGEIFGSHLNSKVSDISSRQASTLETIGGIRHYIKPDLALHAGAGTELTHSTSSPDARIYAGINWTMRSKSKTKTLAKPKAPSKKVISKERKPDKTIVINDVLFKFNSAQVDHKSAKKNLKKVGSVITGPRGLDRLVIEGHTCSIGTTQYNYKLSKRRALSIKAWLAKQYKVNPNKIVTLGFGESYPIASNKLVDGRKRNRRVEFKVYHTQKNNIAKN